jgi:hypothetical protein
MTVFGSQGALKKYEAGIHELTPPILRVSFWRLPNQAEICVTEITR